MKTVTSISSPRIELERGQTVEDVAAHEMLAVIRRLLDAHRRVFLATYHVTVEPGEYRDKPAIRINLPKGKPAEAG